MNRDRIRMAFFRGSIDDVSEVVDQGLKADRFVTKWRHLSGPVLVRSVEAEFPLEDGPPCCALFSSPACPGWTAFISPMDDGWKTLVNATAANAPSIEAVFVSDTAGQSKYPVCGFELFRNGRSVRTVRAWKDDGGHFINVGEVLPFEDPQPYSSRVIAKRLTTSALSDMLLKIGIDLWCFFDEPATDARLLTTLFGNDAS